MRDLQGLMRDPQRGRQAWQGGMFGKEEAMFDFQGFMFHCQQGMFDTQALMSGPHDSFLDCKGNNPVNKAFMMDV